MNIKDVFKLETNIFIKRQFENSFQNSVKLHPKVFSLSYLISSNQTAYAEGRFINEDGALLSDILHVTDFLSLRGLVVLEDIYKAIDSGNHLF